jgi:predicted DNA-binding protein (MmcQ/YjbR family)
MAARKAAAGRGGETRTAAKKTTSKKKATGRAGDAKARARRAAKGRPEEPQSRFFAAIQRACLALPGAVEEYPWGDVVWKAGDKMFAATGTGEPMGVTVKPAPETALTLQGDPAVAPAKYVGRYGWVTVTVTDARTRDLALALCAESHSVIAGNSARRRP